MIKGCEDVRQLSDDSQAMVKRLSDNSQTMVRRLSFYVYFIHHSDAAVMVAGSPQVGAQLKLVETERQRSYRIRIS